MPTNSRTTMLARVGIDTPEQIHKVAMQLGYLYGKKGSLGRLLDAIADGEVALTRVVVTKTEVKVSRSKEK